MDKMILGLAIFFAVHLFPSATSVRSLVVSKLGANGYKALFSLLSFAGLALVVIGKGQAEFTPVWEPASWSYVVTNICVMLALFCLVAFKMPSNLKRFTAHPMLWGITLWSCGHLFTNGDLASITLFGSFLAYSLIDMALATRRGARPTGRKVPFISDAAIAVIAAGVYVALANLHPYFTGASLIR